MTVVQVPAVAEFRDGLIRRRRRGLWIGAAVGVGLVVLLAVLAGLLFSTSSPRSDRSVSDFIPVVVQLAMIVVLGMGAGQMRGSVWATQVLREVAGGWPEGARVRRSVFKGQAPLNEDEQARARAFAPLAGVYLQQQAYGTALFFAAITINAFVQAITGPTDAPALHAAQWIVAIGLVICAAVLFPLQQRRARIAADYANHPHPVVLSTDRAPGGRR